MPTGLMSTRALHRAVDRAILAPSVHNTQPWRFVLRPGTLEIYADPSRRLAVLDPTGRQLHISIGCALLNARVALAAAQLPVRVSRLPVRSNPLLVARVDADESAAVPRDLAILDPVVELRQTNRRRFATDEVPADIVTMLRRAAQAEGAHLHVVTRDDDRAALARIFQRADAEQIANAAYRAELRSWTTSDPARRDGVPASAVPHVDGTADDDIPLRDFDTQGVGWLPAQTRSSASQCLLVLGTASDSALDWLRAGEALEHVWLETTRAGFVASLFTQAIELEHLRVQLRAELRLDMAPHVVLRVGRAATTAASQRRHVGEVLDDRSRADEP